MHRTTARPPKIEAFSSTLLLWIADCIIRIIVVAVLLLLLLALRMLLSGVPMLPLLCAITGLGVGLLRGRLGIGLMLLIVAGLGGIRVFHLPVLIAPSSSLASVVDDVEHLLVHVAGSPALGIAANSVWASICSPPAIRAWTSCDEENS